MNICVSETIVIYIIRVFCRRLRYRPWYKKNTHKDTDAVISCSLKVGYININKRSSYLYLTYESVLKFSLFYNISICEKMTITNRQWFLHSKWFLIMLIKLIPLNPYVFQVQDPPTCFLCSCLVFFFLDFWSEHFSLSLHVTCIWRHSLHTFLNKKNMCLFTSNKKKVHHNTVHAFCEIHKRIQPHSVKKKTFL